MGVIDIKQGVKVFAGMQCINFTNELVPLLLVPNVET